jgi:UTP-glucose-1-phosphate uridylyltransferase
MKYKVLIPSAGLGTRLGALSKYMSKSLVTIYDKPSISYIIEKFPENIEIVVAVGYKSKLLKDFFDIAYPRRKITVVHIDKYEGVGSGLGYTVLKCKKHLQIPFVFCTNDTIVLEDVPAPDHNWIGYDEIYDNDLYRSLKIVDGTVKGINEKGHKIKAPAAVGIHGIYNYKEFWKVMEDGVSFGSISTGELYGIRELIEPFGITPYKFTWFDTGSIPGIEKARQYFDTGEYNILPKAEESIWFIEGVSIKYSNDKKFIADRVIRNHNLKPFAPDIINMNENMYAYKYVNGTILSKCINLPIFKRLLKELKDFWIPTPLSNLNSNEFKSKCLEFYKDKSIKRIDTYYIQNNYDDKAETINGVKVPKLGKLLAQLDWKNLSAGIPATYHGDLHFENILLSETNEFIFLDWRQNFGGIIEYGDIYYDLAKLLHGIIVSHQIVNDELFAIDDQEKIINLNIYRAQSHVEIENYFYKYLQKEGYDIRKVKILTSLIYLNIAALHHYPYSKFLFFFGKYMLNNILNEST